MNDLYKTINQPIIITSFNRCQVHNKKVKGLLNSYHLTGQAVDFYFRGTDHIKISELLLHLYDTDKIKGGLGIYKTFFHVDSGIKRLWRDY